MTHTNLPPLTETAERAISENQHFFANLLKKTERLYGLAGFGFAGLGATLPANQNKMKTFSESVEEYNTGISDDEIRAWVWFKRSLGNPMKGWEKYYLKGSEASEMLTTTKDTMIYDNRYQELRTVPAGVVIGKYLRKQEQGGRGTFYIFRSDAGIEMVNSSSVKLEKSSATADKEQLIELIKAGALYYHGGELLPYPIYTYANIYERESQLLADRETIMQNFGAGIYELHEKALKAVKPLELSVTNPDEKLRPIITCVSKIATDTNEFSIKLVRDEYMSDVEKSEELKKVNGQVQRKASKERIRLDFDGENFYSLVAVFSKWLFTLNVDEDFTESHPIDIVSYYINGQPLRDDKLSSAEKAAIKANARNEGEKLFARFLHEVLTPEDQLRLDKAFNSRYNGHSDLQYQRIPIGFESSTRFKSGLFQMTPIQREGVAFMQAVGSGIVAYDVGVGKTMTAIVTLANEIFQGKVKRPLIVVPKPTYQKWINEIIGYEKNGETIFGVLSNTGVTINDWYNLGTEVLKEIDVTHKVPEKSITIVSYEGFKKIGYSNGVIDQLLEELIKILENPGGVVSEREWEKKMQKYREMIGVGLKDTVCDIDKVEFDYLVIDEAHRCKNVFEDVSADEDGKKRYSMKGGQSETGVKAFLLANYLQRKFGRCSMLLTATPFTNSPLEIYSMLSLVGYDYMVKNGIKKIREFFDLFVLPTTEWVANYKEEIVEKEVIKSFVNREALQKLIFNHITYKTGEEAGVKRPCKINLPRVNETADGGLIRRLPPEKQILTYLQMTPKQRENQNHIVAYANSAKGKDMSVILRALGMSLDNALSPYIYRTEAELDYLTFVNDSPKIKYCCDSIATVKAYHEAKGETCSGQVIYMNRGKEFFSFIREYLYEEVGFQRTVEYKYTDERGKQRTARISEVEIISSEVNDDRKETIKEAFLAGIVKVIIGTATIREGIDLQTRGTCIYNLYPEWNPTDIRQLEGRIWRQGNKFGYVRVVMPLVQDSMDIFVFQKLEEKQARINDIWYRANRGNVLDLESLDAQEVKLALITDINRIVRLLFDQEKEQMEREYKRKKNAIEVIEEVESDIRRYYALRKTMIETLTSFMREMKEHDVFEKKTYKIEAERKEHKALLTRATELVTDLETFLSSSTQDDKDLLALLRRMESASDVFRVYPNNSYQISYFKEYVAKVRKTERTYLIPKKLTIDSDLSEAIAAYKKDLAELEMRAMLYTHGEVLDNNGNVVVQKVNREEETTRWGELLTEAAEKKSAMNVEAKSTESRVAEFAQLNYLLDFSMEETKQGETCTIPQPKIAAAQSTQDNAFQFELELLELELELA